MRRAALENPELLFNTNNLQKFYPGQHILVYMSPEKRASLGGDGLSEAMTERNYLNEGLEFGKRGTANGYYDDQVRRKKKKKLRKSYNDTLGSQKQQEEYKEQALKGWEGDEVANIEEEDDFIFG